MPRLATDKWGRFIANIHHMNLFEPRVKSRNNSVVKHGQTLVYMRN